MNIQDHLTQDQSPLKIKYDEEYDTQDQSTLKRKYDEEHDTQDQSTQDQSPIKRKYDEEHDTQDQTPIKRKCEYLDVNIHKNMSEKRNGNFIIHDKVCTCCERMMNEISEYTSTVTGENYKIRKKHTI